MNWHKDNRARITDFFRRQDRDHDGKISREEFIEGILSSSKYILSVFTFKPFILFLSYKSNIKISSFLKSVWWEF